MSTPLTIDKTVRERQAKASNPALSAWVGANAGSGKTFVLARRVIRLLLNGANPAKILCLTFTKAAAAEMSERVFSELAQWTTLDDYALGEIILDLTGKPPSPDRLAQARQLFAHALETPGGLKIQTIHAFCERLLHQFPVEANVAGHFEVLDDVGREHLLREAERDVLLQAAQDPTGIVAISLSGALTHSSDKGYQNALRDFLTQHQKITDWIDKAGGIEGAIDELRAFFNLKTNDTATGLQKEMLELQHFTTSYLEGLRQELLESSSRFQAQGQRVTSFLSNASHTQRYQALLDFFFTQKGEAKNIKSIASKAILDDFHNLEERITSEQSRLTELIDRQKGLSTVDATKALLVLGTMVGERYRAKKATSGMMDFDDLVEKAANLLEKPDAASWVHYKLDQGLDHILVDEAQDTSPRQWDVIKHLADEFFAGESARRLERTLFAVGDEKQSIYSFQGASPDEFSRMRDHFKGNAHHAQKTFEEVPLSLSFRSSEDVLGAVDMVFQTDTMAAHLTDDYVPHTAARQQQPGFVELWKPFAKPIMPAHEGEWWRPLDQLGETSEKVQLANAIAKTIKTMLDESATLEGTGEPIRAGDILILTRKRGAQVEAINRALKTEGIAVAGSDRLKLMDNIAILDLLALADFVLLSEDDLALAGLLKSPLVGLDEEELFTLCHDRHGTVWNELFIRAKRGEAPFEEAYHKLDKWRREADFTPPYDFFLQVLSRDKGRQAFLTALGQESDEVLEAFLNEVLNFEQSEVPTLQGFVSWFRQGAVEIKRDLEAARNEVRVMTVHGAKGLEAPIVFLIDGGAPFHASHQPDLLGLGPKGSAPFIWKRPNEHRTRAQAASLEHEKSAAMAEYYRLLYVAMTRARDRLYVASTANDKGQPIKGGWFEVVQKALFNDVNCRENVNEDGEAISWRWKVSSAEPVAQKEYANISEPQSSPPAWLTKDAPSAIIRARHLTPSRTGETNDETDFGKPVPSDLLTKIPALERGSLMHRLLEHLPDIAPPDREVIAKTFLKSSLPEGADRVCEAIIFEVLGVLNDPVTAPLFNCKGAKSEVPVYGTVTLNGQPYTVKGEIDRLIIRDNKVHIIDFKTNRQIPDKPADAPISYIRQLALYRALMAPIFVDKHIITSLLWTKRPVLMEIKETDLEKALGTL